jgi:hypothetical protein
METSELIPPPGFTLDDAPAPPAGFVLDDPPAPPAGFVLDGGPPPGASGQSDDVGTLRGLAASVQRGVKRMTGLPDVLTAAALRDAGKSSIRQERKAYEAAMTDPRYMMAALDDPGRAELLFGPQTKLDLAMTPQRLMQQFAAEDVAANEAAIAALPRSAAQRELATTADRWAAWRKNPIELTASIALESLPPSIAGAIAGTAIGGPGVGTAVGAGAGSGLMTFSGELLGEAGRQGYDVQQPDQLQAFLNDAKAFDAAVNVATTKAGIIAPVDALTAGTAGRFIGPALNQGLRRTLLASGQELGVQAAGGASGEAIAQMMSGQPLDTFDVAMEGIAELGSAPVEVASNLRKSVTSNQKPVSAATPAETFSEFGGEATTAPEPVAREAAAADVQTGYGSNTQTGESAPTTGEQLSVPPPPAGFVVDDSPPQSAQPISETVPEAPNTLYAQFDWLRRGKRAAVMLPADGFVPAWVSSADGRFAMHETSAGAFAYDTSALTKDQIDQAVANNTLGNVLGYGIAAKPAPGTEVGTVVVRDKQGTEKQAVVTDAANLTAVLKRAQELADATDVVKLETAEEVIAGRQREIEAAQPKETERQRMARENVEAMAELRKQKEQSAAGVSQRDVARSAEPEAAPAEGSTARAASSPVAARPELPQVTEAHLQQAREAVAQMRGESLERAPDILDDLDGVTRGPIRVPAELEDIIDASRERLAEALHNKPWRRLSSAQRKVINGQLRVTTKDGFAANEALPGLGDKWSGLTVDDLTNAILDAAEGRLLQTRKEDSAEIKAMAQEIAAAEAAQANEVVDDWDMAAAVAQAEAGIDETQFRDHIQPVAQQYGATPEQISTVFQEGQKAYQAELPLQSGGAPASVAGQSGRGSTSLTTFARKDLAHDFGTGNRISSIDQRKAPPAVPTYNVNGTRIDSPLDFVRTLTALRSPNNESLKVVILDDRNVVVHSEVLSAGTLDAIPVDYRDFARLAEKHSSQGRRMLISHNHPSGDPTPSQADIDVTLKLRQAASSAGFQIIDHVITNGGTFYSLEAKELRSLPEYQQADWETVRRDKIRKLDSALDFGELVSTLRAIATPDATHIMYGSTRGHVNAIERAYVSTVGELEKLVLNGIGRESAAAIWIDYGPNVPAYQAQTRTGKINKMLADASSTTRVRDFAAHNLPSGYLAGLQDSPGVTDTGDKLREDASKYAARATGEKIRATEFISPEVKRAIQEYLYEPRSNRTDAETAAGIVTAHGVAAAMQLWRTPPAWMPGAVRSKLLGAITRQLATAEREARAAQDTATAEALIQQQAALWDEALPQITNTAQELQALNDLVAMSPDAQVARAKRQVEAAGENEVERHRGETDAMRTALDEGRTQGVNQLRQDPEANAAAREAVNETVANSQETHRAIVMELAQPWAQSEYILNTAREAVRAKANELLNTQPRPPGLTPAAHLRQMLDDLAGRAASIFASHIQGAEPGISIVDKLQQRLGLTKEKAQQLASSLSKEWDKQLEAARKGLDARIAAARVRQERREREAESATALDQAIRKQLREMNVKLGEAIRQAASDRQRTGEHIADAIVDKSGLTGAKADALRTRLRKRYDELTAEAQRAALAAIEKRSTVKVTRKLREAFDRLIELDRLAPVEGEAFFTAVRAALKLPALTEAQAKELRTLIAEAQAAPEGFQRQRLMARALTLTEKAKGALAWHDVPFSIWYANIFSGIPTHLANMIGNSMKALEVIGITALRQPTQTGQILRAFARGMESGGLEAANVMVTGQLEGTRLLKAEPARPLEAQIQQGGLRRLLLPWALVGRALGAEDVLFFKGHEEVRWQMLARRIAKEEGLRGEHLDARVQDLLHNTRAEYDAAKVQAATEGLSGLDLRRRAHELIEQARERDMKGSTDIARSFGLEHTFNAQPYGVMGALAEVLNNANQKLVVTRFAVPVVRIMANLANESLNYFPPVGLARVMVPKFRSDIVVRAEGDTEALAFYQARAMVGTVLFGALAALLFGGDDEDRAIELTGVGPRTKNQREQLRGTGWKANSIRIGDRWYSYQESQLNIPLAILGNYSDALKYQGLTEEDALNRVAYTSQMLLNTILEQRMLSGVSDLVGALQPGGTGSELGRLLSRSGTSFVVPNALRFVDQVFDPAVYEADDVKAALYAQTPWVRRLNRPALNALGEAVERAPLDRFTTPVLPDALLQIIAQKNAWVPMPNLDNATVGDLAEYRRPMTPDEYYQWIAESGPEIRRRLTEKLDQLALMEPEQAQAFVRDIAAEERAKVKRQFKF